MLLWYYLTTCYQKLPHVNLNNKYGALTKGHLAQVCIKKRENKGKRLSKDTKMQQHPWSSFCLICFTRYSLTVLWIFQKWKTPTLWTSGKRYSSIFRFFFFLQDCNGIPLCKYWRCYAPWSTLWCWHFDFMHLTRFIIDHRNQLEFVTDASVLI